MAVVFQQQDPFNPLAAYGAGQADVMARNNPVIAGGYESSARLGTQIAESRADRSSRERMQQRDIQLQQQAQLQRQTEANYDNIQSGIENDSRVQLSRQGMEDERQGQYNQQAFQAARDQYAAQQEQAQIAKRAEAAAWVNQQDMTFRDHQQMKKMQAAVSDIETMRMRGEITPDVAADMTLQAKTGLSGYQTRLAATQARAQEEKVVAMKADNDLRMKIDAENSQAVESIRNQIHMQDPAVMAAVMEEMGGAAAQARAAAGGPAGIAAFQAEAKKRAALKSPQGFHKGWYETKDGRLLPQFEQYKPEKPEQLQISVGDAMKFAEAEAMALHPPVVDENGKERLPTEHHQAKYKALQKYIGGGQGQGGQGNPQSPDEINSKDPASWTTGFRYEDPSSQTKGQKAWVADQVRGIESVRAGAYTPESKKDVEEAIHKKILIAADPSIPPERKKQLLAELGKVQPQPLPAQQPPVVALVPQGPRGPQAFGDARGGLGRVADELDVLTQNQKMFGPAGPPGAISPPPQRPRNWLERVQDAIPDIPGI